MRAQFLRERADIDWTAVGAKVKQLLDSRVDAKVRELMKPVSILDQDFEQKIESLPHDEARASVMEHALRAQINERIDENPAFYERLSEALERIIRELRERLIDAAEACKQFAELRAEIGREEATASEHGLTGPHPMTERGEIRHGDSRIAYQVVRSTKRRKTIEVTVDAPGVVTVAAPADTTHEHIEATMRRRAGWIIKHDGEAAAALPPRRFVSGESLPYLGRSVPLTVHPVDGNQVEVRFHHWQFDARVPRTLEGDERIEAVRAAFEAWYRERAALKLPPRVDRIASLLGVRPTRILVRGQRKRWASCAPDGTLRFSWRTVLAPPALVDYIVAHELAHLRVRDHGADYWGVVAQAVPDYRRRRERLREFGPRLVM